MTRQEGILSPPGLETRLQSRYVHWVKEHPHAATAFASGLSALAGIEDRVCEHAGRLTILRQRHALGPLQEAGREGGTASSSAAVLLIHDWSTLAFGTHSSKPYRVQLTHRHDVGYELSAALIGRRGDPLAPMEVRPRAEDRVHSTRTPAPKTAAKRLDQLLPTMKAAAGWGLDKTLVHIIDREADSVGHFRKWTAQGHLLLVRADAARSVHLHRLARLPRSGRHGSDWRTGGH